MYRQYKMATADEVDLIQCLKQLLLNEVDTDSTLLSQEDVSVLLSEENRENSVRPGIVGYPQGPLYAQLGAMLQIWMETGQCPALDLPSYDLLDERSYVEERTRTIAQVSPLLKSLKSLSSQEEMLGKVKEIIQVLGRRGLLDLLGLRRTVGTLDLWPPPRTVLENTFNAKHKPQSGSLLTVGARALAKHCHRDHSSSWWGTCTGKEEEKNAHARALVTNILDNATWINIHQMVHETKIIEARQENGYGARWTYDGSQFRGFLEPQMVDGHEVGWRH